MGQEATFMIKSSLKRKVCTAMSILTKLQRSKLIFVTVSRSGLEKKSARNGEHRKFGNQFVHLWKTSHVMILNIVYST